MYYHCLSEAITARPVYLVTRLPGACSTLTPTPLGALHPASNVDARSCKRCSEGGVTSQARHVPVSCYRWLGGGPAAVCSRLDACALLTTVQERGAEPHLKGGTSRPVPSQDRRKPALAPERPHSYPKWCGEGRYPPARPFPAGRFRAPPPAPQQLQRTQKGPPPPSLEITKIERKTLNP